LPVIDASAAVELLIGSEVGRALERRLGGIATLEAPHLIDFEAASALRRLEARELLEPRRAAEALADFARLPVERYPAEGLLSRIWELRVTHTAYDGAYVALAELLAEPLLTADAGLFRSHGHRAEIELFAS
jgi:predicted nucleic acid-binding protein